MNHVVCIGSAVVDIFISAATLDAKSGVQEQVFNLPVGAKVELDSMQLFSGGAGTNTAVGFQRLGFDSASITEVGKDTFGQFIKAELLGEQVDLRYMVTERSEQTGGTVILVGHDGSRTALVHRGAAGMLDPQDISAKALASARWVHVSALGGKINTLKTVFQFARQHTVSVSWNPGTAELGQLAETGIVDLGLKCDILIMNQEEWLMVAAIQDQLLQSVNEVIITNGKHGGTVYQRETEYLKYQAVPVDSVDDTGAGDAFSTAYVAARMSEQPIRVATEWGVRNAGSVVQKVGAKPGLLTRAQLETMK